MPVRYPSFSQAGAQRKSLKKSHHTTPLDQISCAAPVPYPCIEKIDKNNRWIPMLLFDYASQKGKLTCFTQYTHQSIWLKQKNRKISDFFFDMAQVELKHLILLGDLLICLGGSAQFLSNHLGYPIPWNGSMPTYCTSLPKMIEQDLRMEKQLMTIFMHQIEQINHDTICKVMERILLDDQLHIKRLEDLLKHLS